jgi:hypothetical protein
MGPRDLPAQVLAAGLWLAAGCMSSGSRPAASEHGPPAADPGRVAAPADPSGAPQGSIPGPTDAESLSVFQWTDMPVHVHRGHATVFATRDADFAVVRGGSFEQDGRLTRTPPCAAGETTPAQIVGLAGAWPGRLFLLQRSPDSGAPMQLLRWDDTRWTRIERIVDANARLTTVGDAPVLVTHVGGSKPGYRLRALAGTIPGTHDPTPDPTDRCTTALSSVEGVHANALGHLVVWGRACDGAAAVEHFAPGHPPRTMQWSARPVHDVTLGSDGRARIALGDPPEVVIEDGRNGSTLGEMPGTVVALAAHGPNLLALVEGERTRRLLRYASGWTEVVTTPDVGALVDLESIDRMVVLTTDEGSFATTAPARVWDWTTRGCGTLPIAEARPYLFRPRRPARWSCVGDPFLLVATAPDLPAPAAWTAMHDVLAPWTDNGWAWARAERVQANRPRFADVDDGGRPGPRVVPMVVRELDEVHFGYRIVGEDEIVETVADRLQGSTGARRSATEPRWLCARPIGLPEAAVRALLAPP